MKRIALAGALLAIAVPGTAAAQDPAPAEKNAAKACKQQRESLGAETFKLTYGTNKNRRNAFGKCVSKFERVAEEAHSNAAKECKAEREADPEAFREKYGTNASKRNAYGKCVSSKSREEVQEEVETTENAAKACKAERAEDPDAFKEKYGTNANKRNAFGKCVSAKSKEQKEDESEAPAQTGTEETPTQS